MVAWRLVLATPEYPEGREMILIANDLTYLIGSFGPREDILFNKASILARERKVPRVSIILYHSNINNFQSDVTKVVFFFSFDIDIHFMQQRCSHRFG